MGNDVSDFFLEVLDNGLNFDDLNANSIVLIPKISNPMKMVNF